jgi:hypothetical protein
MNTEQIMVLAKRFNLEELRSAVEALVQERHKRGVLAIANGIKAEALVQELDALRMDATDNKMKFDGCKVLYDKLAAENKVLRDAAEFEFVGYALPDSAFDGMVIRKQRLSSDSIPLYKRSKS